ncbi:hypothetical protein pah_c200o026 [Parachlamydia acanthamoebae str. Hall's coccus]|nr:hypothetical protein pah_c200o026 [Parachlamydia acanthamoebae str. Hall's coccus]
MSSKRWGLRNDSTSSFSIFRSCLSETSVLPLETGAPVFLDDCVFSDLFDTFFRKVIKSFYEIADSFFLRCKSLFKRF